MVRIRFHGWGSEDLYWQPGRGLYYFAVLIIWCLAIVPDPETTAGRLVGNFFPLASTVFLILS
jgi:hypothetical protein